VSRKGCKEEIPPGNHPCWKQWTIPLQNFLVKPRDWVELEAWRKEQSPVVSGWLLRNMLAWLETHRLARSDYREGEIVWMRRREAC
jgi:hypothetical protein